MRIDIKLKNGKVITINRETDTISSDELKFVMDMALFFRTNAAEPMIE